MKIPILTKIPVGIRPNGLSYDPQSGLLLAAHVGDPDIPGSTTVSLIHIAEKRIVATILVPGHSRWTVFNSASNAFYVNIADPALIVIIRASQPTKILTSFPISVSGPHGLDIDAVSGRLFCACDSAKLVTMELLSGKHLTASDLSGAPDVIFYNAALQHLYVAIGTPGVIDVSDTRAMEPIQTVITAPGAHTLAFDPSRNKVYAFLPETHRAVIFQDSL